MKELIINGIVIELEKKKIKNMYLRILPPDGKVHISSPYRMTDEEIRRFVLSKLDWIELHQKKIQNRNQINEITYVTGDTVTVWGRSLLLQVNEGYPQNSIRIIQNQLILSVKNNSTQDQRKKVLDIWYRKALEQELPYLISKWEQVIGVKSSGFTIRDMKTRWGTCNIRTKNICMNLQLAKKPPKCLEYVVVHELVHLLERSHNAVFKAYMDKYLPQWRTIRKELNGIVS